MSGVAIQEYAKVYNFTTVVQRERASVAALQEAAQQEAYPARRRVLELQAIRRKNEEALGAEPITIGILRRGDWFAILQPKTNPLYLGGIEQRLTWRNMGPGYTPTWHSLYVGPLPEWVQAKYEMAKRFFPRDCLAVVSRHRAFFDMQEQIIEPLAKLSPLLLAFDKDDTVYLLAAWGLEYELPQSLGGLLPDAV